MRKFTLTTLTILSLVLAVILTGCFGKPTVNQNQNVNLNTNTATTTEEIDTSNWKTYRNEEYGFEFKYPDDWEYKLKISDRTGDEFVEFWNKDYQPILAEAFPNLIVSSKKDVKNTEVEQRISDSFDLGLELTIDEFAEKYSAQASIRDDMLGLNENLFKVIFKRDLYDVFHYYFFDANNNTLISVTSLLNASTYNVMNEIVKSFIFIK